MWKKRIFFWCISLCICSAIIIVYQDNMKKIPYDEKTTISTYCPEKIREKTKKVIEDSKIGKTHKIVFTNNKNTAEVVLTDKITTTDSGYEKVGWTPLIVAFDIKNENKKESYKKNGYFEEFKSGRYIKYTVNFKKVIEDTLDGKWKDKIYCPNPNTREGEIFFDFLLVSINGRYPKNYEEINSCTKRANEFLDNSLVVQCDVNERLERKRVIENELYIIFEKDIYNMEDGYEYDISYPSNTVTCDYYYYHKGGDNTEDLEESILESMCKNGIRSEIYYGDAISSSYYHVSNGFSYVEIPLKEK